MKQRRFSAARRPDDADEFTLLDFEIDILQSGRERAPRICIASENSAQGDAFFLWSRRRVERSDIRGGVFFRSDPLRQLFVFRQHPAPGDGTADQVQDVIAHCTGLAFFSRRTSLSRVRSYRPDRSGRVLPKNPSSNACWVDFKSDVRIGSYVTCIRENASSKTSEARGLPFSF